MGTLMNYAFKYELTEEEKRVVRTMLSSGLARHGVPCVVSTDVLLEGLGSGPEGLLCLPRLASRLETLEVTEIRDGLTQSFRIFKNVKPVEGPREQACWRYSFTRDFLKFSVGRPL
jgi:hypothetical protein